jgi:hypothetical protein
LIGLAAFPPDVGYCQPRVQTKAEHGVVAAFRRMHLDALKTASGALATGLVPDHRPSFVDPGRCRDRRRTPQP